MTDCKIGDFVEVDIGHGFCISSYAQIITEHSHPYTNEQQYTVRFTKDDGMKPLSGETHMTVKEFMRVLSEKEVFELRLKGLI